MEQNHILFKFLYNRYVLRKKMQKIILTYSLNLERCSYAHRMPIPINY